MADVILFFPKTGMDSIVQLPLSILCVASTIPDYDVLLVDERVNSDPLEIVERKSPNAICLGISAMTGMQIHRGLKASKVAKEHTKTVWGGVHPTLEPGQTLGNKNIDIVVRGEGELTFPDLIRSLEAGSDLKNVKGIGFKDKANKRVFTQDRGFANMNDFPDLPYHMLKMENYITQRDGFKRCLNLQTSRGCPHDCTFCLNPVYNKRLWRGFTARRMVDRTEELKTEYGLDGIVYQEDNFFANINRILQFCLLMRERNIDIGWKANCRISYLIDKDSGFFRILERSGCKVLQFGIESGSNRILEILNKRTTVEQIRAVNRKLARTGLKCRYNFMVGIPGESLEEIETTLAFIGALKRENQNLESCFVNVYAPWPGTGLFQESVQEGFVPPSTLEGWATFNWNKTKMPWIDSSTAKLLAKVSKEYLRSSGYFKDKSDGSRN